MLPRPPGMAVEMREFVGRGGQTGVMLQTTKDELRRQRLREYEAALTEARASVSVLVQFVKGRQARSGGGLLEEAFAASSVEGVDDAHLFPAAVWVTLRQGDVDATLDTMVQLSTKEFVVGEHERLDTGYRLTTVEERRALPDVELLQLQIAGFLHIPCDVVAVIASWGADDPRTASEVDSLLEQRFGSVAPGAAESATAGTPTREGVATDADLASDPTGGAGGDPAAGLTLSSAEFIALLHLTPEQGTILETLVRQTAITIGVNG
jgi:hypothetical protein